MKPKFKIGDFVVVIKTVHFYYDKDNYRRLETTSCRAFLAQIVGARRKFLGRYKEGGVYGAGFEQLEPEYEPNYLQVDGSILVWLVRKGITNKEIEVLEEHIALVESPPTLRTAPLRWRAVEYDESVIKAYRDIGKDLAKEMKRDKKGRWVKYDTST